MNSPAIAVSKPYPCKTHVQQIYKNLISLLNGVNFILTRQWLMPLIKRSRDAELAGVAAAGQRFKRLHQVSVIINGLHWLATVAALIPVLM